MERCSKLKVGRKETHDTGDTGPHLEVERSKVKITSQNKLSFAVRPIAGGTPDK